MLHTHSFNFSIFNLEDAKNKDTQYGTHLEIQQTIRMHSCTLAKYRTGPASFGSAYYVNQSSRRLSIIIIFRQTTPPKIKTRFQWQIARITKLKFDYHFIVLRWRWRLQYRQQRLLVRLTSSRRSTVKSKIEHIQHEYQK